MTGEDFYLTDRGFLVMPPVSGLHPQDTICVYESSLAEEPAVWIAMTSPADRNDPRGVTRGACAEFSLEAAALLRDQLNYFLENHYQKRLR